MATPMFKPEHIAIVNTARETIINDITYMSYKYKAPCKVGNDIYTYTDDKGNVAIVSSQNPIALYIAHLKHMFVLICDDAALAKFLHRYLDELAGDKSARLNLYIPHNRVIYENRYGTVRYIRGDFEKKGTVHNYLKMIAEITAKSRTWLA